MCRVWVVWLGLLGTVWSISYADVKTMAHIPTTAASPAPQELWLSAQLNRYSTPQTLFFVKNANGQLLMLAEDWQRWYLKPATHIVRYDEQDYYNLDELQGVSYQFDAANLTLAIAVEATWFMASVFDAKQHTQSTHIQSAVGASLNYELISNYSAQQSNSNLLSSGTFFHPMGLLDTQWFFRHLEDSQRDSIRLNSTFIKDDFAHIATLKIGDSITSSLGLGGGLRFAGIQWATNFAIQPQLVRFPTPSITAQALLPATVDVYINNAKSWSKQVPAGEFTINDIPISAGKGEARIVVKDLLGREQTLIVPYYAGADLLTTDLQEYALESGFLRQNYGEVSNDYGDFFAMMAYRRGLNDQVTGELQLQWQTQQQMLRYGGVFLLPKLGLINTWLAQSMHDSLQTAYAYGMSIEPQYQRLTSRISWQRQDKRFSELGTVPSNNPLQQSWRVFLGISPKDYGSLSLQYNEDKNYQQPPTRNMQASYGISLGTYGSLSVSVGRTLNPIADTSAQLNLTIPLQQNQTFSWSSQPLDRQNRLSIQQSVPAGTGIGYGLSADIGPIARTQGHVIWQNTYGNYQLQIAEQNNDYAGTVTVSGGMAYLQGQGFWGRQIDNSFAVVKVGDYPDVKVYGNNHLIGTTNQQGVLLIPRLQPYISNKLRIDAADLPFDAEMTSAEQLVTPAFKSGVWLDFKVKRAYAATMTVLLKDGTPLPAGVEVYKADSTEAFPVGYRGELYITGLSAKNRLTAKWQGQQCSFEVEFAVVDDSLPDLGSYVCQEVQP